MENSNRIYESLKGAGLSDQEIELYDKIKDKGVVSLGEIALITNVENEVAKQLTESLATKKLLKRFPGNVDHFQALPPYAALIAHLSTFSSMIEEMKFTIPTDVKLSLSGLKNSSQGMQNLSKFVIGMQEMRQQLSLELQEQQLSINQILNTLKDQRETALKLTNLKERSLDIVEVFFKTIVEEFADLKKKVRNNLEKLQLGIIVNTVEEMVEKSIDSQLELVKSDMKANFESKLSSVLEDVVEEVMQIPSNALKIESKIKSTFDALITKFDETLESTQSNLHSISGGVSESFGQLNEKYSTKVAITLDEMLGEILNQIHLESTIMDDFWNDAMTNVNFSMKDVWFIRTPEGMQAQIQDTLKRTKMRALIVTPRLTDLDVSIFESLPNHVNIRICASINKQDPKHQKILKILDEKPNISYRQKDIINLWGIHKDYEEIILGIINTSAFNHSDPLAISRIETSSLEVAAVGSVLEEHIKMFVPNLEDAWIGASKELSEGFPVTPVRITEVAGKINSPIRSMNGGLSSHGVSKIKAPLKGISVHFDSDPNQAKLSKERQIEPVTSGDLTSVPSAMDSSSPAKISPPKVQSKTELPKDTHEEKTHNKGKSTTQPKLSKKKETVERLKIEPPKVQIPEVSEKYHLVSPSSQIRKLNEKNQEDETPTKLSPSKLKEQPSSPSMKQKDQKQIQQNKASASPNADNATFVRSPNEEGYPEIIEKIDFIMDILQKNDAHLLINELKTLVKLYEGKSEFSRIVAEINNWSKDLQQNPELDDFKSKIITKRLTNWKKNTIE